MSSKLPVEAVIFDAYKFAFTRFLSVLGTMWLPYLLFTAVVIGLVLLIAPDLPRQIMMQEVDVPALMGLGRLAVLISIVGFVVGAMVTVGPQRKALGRHRGPVYVFFSLGAQVWRMAAALFLAGLIVFFIALLTTGVGAAIWFAAHGLGAARLAVRVLVVLAGFAFVLYIALRLFFFLPAVVVAEGTIGIERAWILGGHNFWRIAVVTIAVVAPVAIAIHLLSWAIFGSYASLHGLSGHFSTREIIRTALLQFGAVGPFVLFLQLIERILILGVLNGATASAYLAVTAGPHASNAAAPQVSVA